MITRPDYALVAPTQLDKAFEDPNMVLDLVRRGSPYKTEDKVHRNPGVERTGGWFRNFWALGGKVVFDGAQEVFDNPIYVQAAADLFNAQVIRPLTMMTNLNLPMAGLPPHLDLPFFRGAMNREVPSWMLVPMGYSGLFHEWAVPIASALAWFYDGPGGEFEYWPDGVESPAQRFAPPFTNTAVIGDNEYTYHRVAAIGHPEDHVADDGLAYDATLALGDDDRWYVHEGDTERGSYGWGEVRLSILWKAFCFENDAEAAAFDDKTNDLTPAQVTELFHNDLNERGIGHVVPADPANDLTWKQLLADTYQPAI